MPVPAANSSGVIYCLSDISLVGSSVNFSEKLISTTNGAKVTINTMKTKKIKSLNTVQITNVVFESIA